MLKTRIIKYLCRLGDKNMFLSSRHHFKTARNTGLRPCFVRLLDFSQNPALSRLEHALSLLGFAKISATTPYAASRRQPEQDDFRSSLLYYVVDFTLRSSFN